MDESEGGEGVRDVPAGDVTRNNVDIVENVGEVTLALIGTEQVCCTPPIKTKIFDYFFFKKQTIISSSETLANVAYVTGSYEVKVSCAECDLKIEYA